MVSHYKSSNFHFVLTPTAPVDKSGTSITALCNKDLDVDNECICFGCKLKKRHKVFLI